MVARLRFTSLGGASAKGGAKGQYRRRQRKRTSFKKGVVANPGGRPKGSMNSFPIQVKEAILTAIERYGLDRKGKDGMVGYFFRMCDDMTLMCRLIEKILPLQVTGRDGGAIQVFSLPPEALQGLPPDELLVLERALASVAMRSAAGMITVSPATPPTTTTNGAAPTTNGAAPSAPDANNYAKIIEHDE